MADSVSPTDVGNVFVEKVTVRRLPVTDPPIPMGGGRVLNDTGEMAQILNGPDTYKFLTFLSFRPTSSRLRGNHYHNKKLELMYLIRGRLIGTYRNLSTGAETTVELETGDLVTIEPNCAHAYLALEDTDAVEMGKDEYDPEDTHGYSLADFDRVV
jgi:mannose-6-phosphate isomerase-like protein (cupin superfamily)